MSRARRCAVFAAVVFATWASVGASARADGDLFPEGAKAPSGTPRVHHGPISNAPAHEAISIAADVDFSQSVTSVELIYKKPDGSLATVPMLRAAAGYTADIPADDVRLPSVAYAIELKLVGGTRVEAFASRSAMHVVQVVEDQSDAEERALFHRMGGRRSVARISGDFVRFGRTTGARPLPCTTAQPGCPAGGSKTPDVDDQYWRVEGSYTYRPFRGVAEFALKAGVIRGSALVEGSTYQPSKYNVGANYAAPTVTFRVLDALHLEFELLTSITEVGFSLGGGNTLTLGDYYGTSLVFGWEAIGFKESYFGSRFFSKMNVATGKRVILSPMVEVTDMPHAESFGVRLLAETRLTLGGGVELDLRGGYQARRSVSGGPSFGGTLAVAF